MSDFAQIPRRSHLSQGIYLGVCLSICYIGLLGLAALFIGSISDLRIHLITIVLVFFSCSISGLIPFDETEGISDNKFYAALDTILVGFILGSPSIFIAASIMQGVLYTLQTINWVGIVILIILVVWFVLNQHNYYKNHRHYATGFDERVYYPVIIAIAIVTTNGLLRNMATLDSTGFSYLIFATGVLIGIMLATKVDD